MSFFAPPKHLDYHRSYAIAAIALAVVGLLFRIYYITQFHHAHDESWHIHIANQPSWWDVVLFNYNTSLHPPLYYVLLHTWLTISHDVFFIRLLSVIFWLATLPFLYAIGQKLVDNYFGVLLICIASFGFGFLEVSTDIREYSLLILFIAIALYCHLRLLERFHTQYFAAYIASSLLAISSHYSAVIIVFILGCGLLFHSLKHKQYKALLLYGSSHVILAAIFIFSYLQHGFWELAEQGEFWTRSYYYIVSVKILSFLITNIGMWFIGSYNIFYITIVPMVVGYGFIVAAKHKNYALLYFGISAVILNFCLDIFHLYPLLRPRFLSWCIIIYLCMLCLTLYHATSHIQRKYKMLLVASISLLLLIFSIPALHYNGLRISKNDYSDAIEQLKTAKDTAIIADLQTAMLFSEDGDIVFKPIDHSSAFHNVSLFSNTLYYPNWHYLDIEDEAGQRLGGINFYSTYLWQHLSLEQLTQYKQFIIVSIGYPATRYPNCYEMMQQHSDSHINETEIGILLLKLDANAFKQLVATCRTAQ